MSVKRFLSHLTAEQLVSGKRPKGRLERQHKYLGRYKKTWEYLCVQRVIYPSVSEYMCTPFVHSLLECLRSTVQRFLSRCLSVCVVDCVLTHSVPR